MRASAPTQAAGYATSTPRAQVAQQQHPAGLTTPPHSRSPTPLLRGQPTFARCHGVVEHQAGRRQLHLHEAATFQSAAYDGQRREHKAAMRGRGAPRVPHLHVGRGRRRQAGSSCGHHHAAALQRSGGRVSFPSSAVSGRGA